MIYHGQRSGNLPRLVLGRLSVKSHVDWITCSVTCSAWLSFRRPAHRAAWCHWRCHQREAIATELLSWPFYTSRFTEQGKVEVYSNTYTTHSNFELVSTNSSYRASLYSVELVLTFHDYHSPHRPFTFYYFFSKLTGDKNPTNFKKEAYRDCIKR